VLFVDGELPATTLQQRIRSIQAGIPESEPQMPAPDLLKVALAAKKSPTQHDATCGLAVVLPGGRRIEVHPDFDMSTFERLVSVLEGV